MHLSKTNGKRKENQSFRAWDGDLVPHTVPGLAARPSNPYEYTAP